MKLKLNYQRKLLFSKLIFKLGDFQLMANTDVAFIVIIEINGYPPIKFNSPGNN